MSYAFVDRRCSNCDGKGCEECDFHGIVGSYKEAPDLPEPLDTVWSRHFRKWRKRNKCSFHDVADKCGMSVSCLSGIETGWIEPTATETDRLIRFILEWGTNTYPVYAEDFADAAEFEARVAALLSVSSMSPKCGTSIGCSKKCEKLRADDHLSTYWCRLKAARIEKEKFILGTAVNVYGINLQFNMLSEECGELLSVANKYLRGRVKVDALIEEVIDVQIMCEQVFILVGCTEEKAEAVRKRKLERLHERLLKREKAMSQAVLEEEQ